MARSRPGGAGFGSGVPMHNVSSSFGTLGATGRLTRLTAAPYYRTGTLPSGRPGRSVRGVLKGPRRRTDRFPVRAIRTIDPPHRTFAGGRIVIGQPDEPNARGLAVQVASLPTNPSLGPAPAGMVRR